MPEHWEEAGSITLKRKVQPCESRGEFSIGGGILKVTEPWFHFQQPNQTELALMMGVGTKDTESTSKIPTGSLAQMTSYYLV